MARLDGAWEKDMKKLQKVATFTLAYCQGKVMAFLVVTVRDLLPPTACRNLCDKLTKKEAYQNLSSAKLALQGVITKAKVKNI